MIIFIAPSEKSDKPTGGISLNCLIYNKFKNGGRKMVETILDLQEEVETKTVYGTIKLQAGKVNQLTKEMMEFCGAEYKLVNACGTRGLYARMSDYEMALNSVTVNVNDRYYVLLIDRFDYTVEYDADTNTFDISFGCESSVDDDILNEGKIESFKIGVMGWFCTDINRERETEVFISELVETSVIDFEFINEEFLK